MEFDGERLKAARLFAGLSQDGLSKRAGVRQNTISDIEIGRHRPQGRTLRKIAEALGVNVEAFYAGVEEGGILSPIGQATARRAEEHLEELRTFAPEDYDEEAFAATLGIINDLGEEVIEAGRGTAAAKKLARLSVRLGREAERLLWRRMAAKQKEPA